ncbi:site-specific integrase [Clostridium sp. P21]|uniref:Site-specific integrase n=1 Tax=Clostridium muellerianum TaxID=2716538 RepID=A0A7Y0EG19_9CLOT|nr:site-specific integrase [Clostridium muellerianum]NMM62736.1 site-specific integrase [Clostridium muellerianum]
MAKVNDTGVYQLEDGSWEYRIVINTKDLKATAKARQDDSGNPFKTKKQAVEARAKKLIELKTPKPPKPIVVKDAKLSEIYEEYMLNGTAQKAKSTIRKQQSMWENHIEKNFGNRYISTITAQELKDYLAKMYAYGDGIESYQGGYSYKYVEGFLKFFYLLYGRAYGHDLIDTDRYTKMVIDKGNRLTMPDRTHEDEEDERNIKSYTMEEIAKIESVFRRGNCYTAFLLGFKLGLRISEVFGLRFSNIDWGNSTVKINRQMGFEDGAICLGPVKTFAAVRTIDLTLPMIEHLFEVDNKQKETREANPDAYRNTEVVLDKDKNGVLLERIVGGDFICRKENGELLTPNSIKYWTRAIKKETGIDFNFHSLRRTHATQMVNLNTPVHELMLRLGHKKFSTTLRFYADENKFTRDKLIENIETIDAAFEKARVYLVEEPKKDAENLAKIQKDLSYLFEETNDEIK